MINEIFIDMISEGIVVVYLDNILIFTRTLEEHWEVTWQVLGRLAEHELYLRPKKCKFEKTRIEYLGLIISEDYVTCGNGPSKSSGSGRLARAKK